jgi:hypothetical protein
MFNSNSPCRISFKNYNQDVTIYHVEKLKKNLPDYRKYNTVYQRCSCPDPRIADMTAICCPKGTPTEMFTEGESIIQSIVQ